MTIKVIIDTNKLKLLKDESSYNNMVYLDVESNTKIKMEYNDDSWQVDILFKSEYDTEWNWVGSFCNRVYEGSTIEFNYGDLWT